MALKGVVTKLEDVAEAFRGEYVKGDDGRFYLSVDSTIEELPTVRGLAAKKNELLGKLAKADETAAASIRERDEKIAALEKGNSGGKNDEKIAALENERKQLVENWGKEKTALLSETEKEKNAARRYFLTSEVRRAIGKLGGDVDLLEHIAERGVKVDRNGDAFTLQVVDAAGNPRIKNSMGEAFTVDDYAAELKTKHPAAFPASGAAGSGAQNGGTGGNLPAGTVSRSKPGWTAEAAKMKAEGKQVTVVD